MLHEFRHRGFDESGLRHPDVKINGKHVDEEDWVRLMSFMLPTEGNDEFHDYQKGALEKKFKLPLNLLMQDGRVLEGILDIQKQAQQYLMKHRTFTGPLLSFE